MQATEEQLARIGFARSRCEPVCWRLARLDLPHTVVPVARSAAEPGCSRALRRWRDRLARGSRSSPYRISRIDDNG